jgi:methyl-accepting chemotaxis protein
VSATFQTITLTEKKQMSTFKRIVAWILIVISVLGILVCSLAIAGSWMVNNSLTQEILGLLSRADTALSRVEDTLTLADARLKDASSAVATIQEAAAKLGDRVEKNSPVLDRISQILKDQLGPAVNNIQDAFLKLEERIQTVNNAIEVVNRLPGIQLSTLDFQLDGPRERVGLVADSVQQLQQNVADFRAGIVQSLAPFMDKLDRIAEFITRLDEEVNTYLKQVNVIQAKLASVTANIPSLIDRIILILSILFFWLILAQVALFLVARVYLKTGQMVWEFIPSKKSQEALPETTL